MELQIVNREIASQLKELGFDWVPQEVYSITREDNTLFNYGEVLDGDNELYAPYQSLVCKWLRKIHNIHVIIDVWIGAKYTFSYNLRECGGKRDIRTPDSGNYATYELAEEAGIIKAIKLLKEK